MRSSSEMSKKNRRSAVSQPFRREWTQPRMMARRWLLWVGVVAVILAAVVGVGPFVYIHFIEADPPPPLTIPSTTPTTTRGSPTERASLAGTWKVTSGSTAGYRVKEVLFGQDNDAAGRTSAVT